MTLDISSVRLNAEAQKLCASALLLAVMAAPALAFPRFGWRSSGQKPVHQAAVHGDAAKLAETIRENAAMANAADAKGNTPLHLAAAHNRVDAARVLLASGAQINATNAEGVTPLMDSARSGGLEVVKLLLKHHADPTIRDAHGWTALKWAKRNRHYEIAMRIVLAEARR